MAPKKKSTSKTPTEPSHRRASSRITQPEVPPTSFEPEYYGLIITQPDHRTLFASLVRRGVEPTRFPHRPTLEALGVLEDVEHLFDVVKWGTLVRISPPTHEKETLEILSTMKIKPKSKERLEPVSVTFQLAGVPRSLTRDDICTIFGCPINAIVSSPTCFYNRDEFWEDMTGMKESFKPGFSKSAKVRNPVLCLTQHILGHTILHRHSSGNMRVEELHILWGMLTDSPLHFGHYLLRQLQSVIAPRGGIIGIGGMLTPIIEHFLGPEQETLECMPGDHSMDIENFIQMKILNTRDLPYLFKQKRGPSFPLPNSALTTVTNFYDHTNWKMNTDEHVQLMVATPEDKDMHTSSPPEGDDGGPSRRRRLDNTDEERYTEIRDQFRDIDAQLSTIRQDVTQIRLHQQEHMAFTRAELEKYTGLHTQLLECQDVEIERRRVFEAQMLQVLGRLETQRLVQGLWHPPPPPPDA